MDQFQKKIAERRARHVESLLTVNDAEPLKHAQIRNVIRGLDEAASLYRETLTKVDDEG